MLYKISATFTTMKLPYGESVSRDIIINSKSYSYNDNSVNNYGLVVVQKNDGSIMRKLTDYSGNSIISER